jgi:hypothetical protein
MKKIYKLLILCGIIGIVISGCKKDDDSSSSNTNTGALSGNTLKGKISDWTLGAGYTLKAFADYYSDNVGEATISSDGSFSLILGTPNLNYLYDVSYYFNSPLTISDPTTKCGYVDLYIYSTATGSYIGSLQRKNNIGSYQKGYAIAEYLYATKSSTVKGTYTSSYGYESYIGTYNLNLKAGWNTVATLCTNVTTTSNYTTYDYKISNSEASTAKWMFMGK